MDCPKCQSQMNEVEGFSFSATKCSGCSGIWFREANHEIAKKLVNSKDIDTSSAQHNTDYNLIRDFDCPESDCQSTMIKMVDSSQMDIELESCSSCYGVFFDAGEFSDFSELTLLERVTRAIDTFKTNLSS